MAVLAAVADAAEKPAMTVAAVEVRGHAVLPEDYAGG